jgi:hypothetical protein
MTIPGCRPDLLADPAGDITTISIYDGLDYYIQVLFLGSDCKLSCAVLFIPQPWSIPPIVFNGEGTYMIKTAQNVSYTNHTFF